jgi:hypothetical protein
MTRAPDAWSDLTMLAPMGEAPWTRTMTLPKNESEMGEGGVKRVGFEARMFGGWAWEEEDWRWWWLIVKGFGADRGEYSGPDLALIGSRFTIVVTLLHVNTGVASWDQVWRSSELIGGFNPSDLCSSVDGWESSGLVDLRSSANSNVCGVLVTVFRRRVTFADGGVESSVTELFRDEAG